MEDDAIVTSGGKSFPLSGATIQYRNQLREALPESLYKKLDEALVTMYRMEKCKD